MAPKGGRRRKEYPPPPPQEDTKVWRGSPLVHDDGYPVYQEDIVGAVVDVTYRTGGKETTYREMVTEYQADTGIFWTSSKGLSDWDGQEFKDRLDLNIMLREGDMRFVELVGLEAEVRYSKRQEWNGVTVVAALGNPNRYMVCSEGLSSWDGDTFCDDIDIAKSLSDGMLRFTGSKRFLGIVPRGGLNCEEDRKAMDQFMELSPEAIIGTVVDVLVDVPPRVARMRVLSYNTGTQLHQVETYGKYGMRDGRNWVTDIDVPELCRNHRLRHVGGPALKEPPRHLSWAAFVEDSVMGEDAPSQERSRARKRPASSGPEAEGKAPMLADSEKAPRLQVAAGTWVGKVVNVLCDKPKRTIKTVRVIKHDIRSGLFTVRADGGQPEEMDLNELDAQNRVELCSPWEHNHRDSGPRAGRTRRTTETLRMQRTIAAASGGGGATASSSSSGRRSRAKAAATGSPAAGTGGSTEPAEPAEPPEKRLRGTGRARITRKSSAAAAAARRRAARTPSPAAAPAAEVGGGGGSGQRYDAEMVGRVVEVAHLDDPNKRFFFAVEEYNPRSRKHLLKPWGPSEDDPECQKCWVDLDGLKVLGRMAVVDGVDTLRRWGHTLLGEEICFLPQDQDSELPTNANAKYLQARIVGWWPQEILPPVATEGMGDVRQAIFMAQEDETGDRWQLKLSDAMVAVAQNYPNSRLPDGSFRRQRVLLEVFAGSCELSLAFHRRGAEAVSYDISLSSEQNFLEDREILHKLEHDEAWDIVHFAPPEEPGNSKLEGKVWAAVRLLHRLNRGFVLESSHRARIWDHEDGAELLKNLVEHGMEFWHVDMAIFGATERRTVNLLTNRARWFEDLKGKASQRALKRPTTRGSAKSAPGDQEQQLRIYPRPFAEAYADGVQAAVFAAPAAGATPAEGAAAAGGQGEPEEAAAASATGSSAVAAVAEAAGPPAAAEAATVEVAPPAAAAADAAAPPAAPSSGGSGTKQPEVVPEDGSDQEAEPAGAAGEGAAAEGQGTAEKQPQPADGS